MEFAASEDKPRLGSQLGPGLSSGRRIQDFLRKRHGRPILKLKLKSSAQVGSEWNERFIVNNTARSRISVFSREHTSRSRRSVYMRCSTFKMLFHRNLTRTKIPRKINFQYT
jgi:hypothetical protein